MPLGQVLTRAYRPTTRAHQRTKGTTMPETDILDRSIDDLELSLRTANCLEFAGIKTVRQLVGKYEAELLKIRNFGRKSLKEIKAVLAESGLELGRPGNLFRDGAPDSSAPRVLNGPPETPSSEGWVSCIPTPQGLALYSGPLLGEGAPLVTVQYREVPGSLVEVRTLRLTTTGLVWRTHLSKARKQPALTTAGTAWAVHELHELQWTHERERESIDRLCMMLLVP